MLQAFVLLFPHPLARRCSFAMSSSSAVSQRLANQLRLHPSIVHGCPYSQWQPAVQEWKVVNGIRWLRVEFPVGTMLPLDMSLAEDFELEHVWMPRGSIACAYHATKMENMLQGSASSPGSNGILSDAGLFCGINGHAGKTGVFAHEAPVGAAWYVTRSRPQWPAEPMLFLELQANVLRKVKGGMMGRHCIPGDPGTLQRKASLKAMWMLGEDIVAASVPRAPAPASVPPPVRPAAPPRTVPAPPAPWPLRPTSPPQDLQKGLKGWLLGHIRASSGLRWARLGQATWQPMQATKLR